MSFSSDIKRFVAKLESREAALFANTVSAVRESITVGSAVTGAPGQPVDTSNLLNSWHIQFEGVRRAAIITNVNYARDIEDRTRRQRLKSAVGGFHSVKLTRTGFKRLVEHEARKLGLT